MQGPKYFTEFTLKYYKTYLFFFQAGHIFILSFLEGGAGNITSAVTIRYAFAADHVPQCVSPSNYPTPYPSLAPGTIRVSKSCRALPAIKVLFHISKELPFFLWHRSVRLYHSILPLNTHFSIRSFDRIKITQAGNPHKHIQNRQVIRLFS